MFGNGIKMLVRGALLLTCIAASAPAAPFAKKIPFTQPDGTEITLFGEGDEFYAVFETLDGYTVVFDQALKAYCYARLAADGNDMLSTGLLVGRADPVALALPLHVRLPSAAARQKARERYLRWDAGVGVDARWAETKAAWQAAEAAAKGGAIVMSPPSFTTMGTKVGLTLLIDFDDDPATISRSDIQAFCNADNYSGYGNNGSVRQYFLENANNLLNYSNTVTIYIRIPNSLHPKSWYNDASKDCGSQGNLLIRDAIAIMTNLPNYTTEILPTFSSLSVDGGNQVIACNIFYAGGNGGVWSYGLWPHSWSLYNVGAQFLEPGGRKIYKYQITNIGASLELGTFCHENGHMLCGFPDIYDYDYDSKGGAGIFCLMNSGGHGANPVQICAYLKRAAGWATTVELNAASLLTASVSSSGANFNRFYRFVKPGVSTEYFLVENRQPAGRDANLPGGGVAIWHIDELGDKDDQRLVANNLHQNYEVTLIQADNQWHYQNNQNNGDANDLYYNGNSASGYANRLSDSTSPHGHWWDGTASGINFKDFSLKGATMTFTVEPFSAVTILPLTGAAFSGPVGGSFSPATFVYTLTNSRAFAINWSGVHTQAWVTAAPLNGTLQAHAATTVVVTLSTSASTFPAGLFTDTLTFTNSSDASTETRAVTLRVGQPDYFTEIFDTTANDVDNQSFIFTPNGSSDHYAVSRTAVTNFPTDPVGGTSLAVGDDGSLLVNLTGGKQVYLYGTAYSSFYVSGNGYITFGSSDNTYTESLSSHFSKPRVAGLFDDLDSSAGGSISWRQLSNRVAVTYQNVPEWNKSNANSLQIELYTNGTLRITCLSIAATDGLIGLAQGAGQPVDFLESDFSAYQDTQPPIFTAVTALPSPARKDTKIAITFTVSETLSANPAVSVNAHPATCIGTTGGNYIYNYTIQDMDADGAATCVIAGTDLAGNPGFITNTTALVVDKTPPDCAITRLGESPTNATVVQFNIVFNEAVTNFAVDDVVLTGTAPGRNITGFIANTPGRYTVTVGDISGTGMVTIAVDSNICTDVAGNLNTAGDPVTYEINKRQAHVILNSLGQFYDGTPRVVTATTIPSGLMTNITYDGSPIPPTNAGSYDVIAIVVDALYDGWTNGILVVDPGHQAILFPTIADQIVTNSIVLSATASSGLPVSFGVASGPAQLSDGSNLTFTGAGSVSVVASQAGDANWAALSKTNTFEVTKAIAQITLLNMVQTYDGNARLVMATTEPPGLLTDFTYDGDTEVPTNAGSYGVIGLVVDALYDGWTNGILVVDPGDQAISFPIIADQIVTNTIVLGAIASSGLPVSFKVASGPAQLSDDSNLTFTGAGNVSVVASQAGDLNWSAALSKTNTFRVFGYYTLTIASAYGVATPATGVYGYVENTVLTNSVTTPDTIGTTQYVCLGWTMIGSEPTNGYTNCFVMTLTNDATLTWQWQTNYWLTITTKGNGTVNQSDGWWISTGQLTAISTPTQYWHSDGWDGQTNGAVLLSSNQFTACMDMPRQIVACFALNYGDFGTPQWWLAAHGIGDDPSAAEVLDIDKDGMAAWEEWIAGTDPTNNMSYLQVLSPEVSDVGTGITVRWPSVTDRLYDVERSTNLMTEALHAIASNLDATAPTNSYPDLTATNLHPYFYRVKAKLK